MRRSSRKPKDRKDDLAHFRNNRNEFNRPFPFEITRSSPFTTETSFPSSLPDHHSSRKQLSFGKLSSQPIRLSVLKLDGSSFGKICICVGIHSFETLLVE